MSVEDFSDALRRRNNPTGDWRDGLAKTESGTARKNLFNACVALRDHPELKDRIAYDEFRGTTWVRGSLPWDVSENRPWTDFDDIKATEWLQTPEIGILVSSGIVREAVQAIAHQNRFHPLMEWLENLQWDGTERLSSWLTTYLGVPSSPLADAFGRKFLISAAARIMRPGCKADHMLILEGEQGILKSKSLHALAGDWFADQIADLGTKDSCQDLRGVWIIELSELSAIRPGEVEKVKAYISRQVDHYRPSYGRRSIDVPRQCVFIGTTNAHEYLSDATGGRRFWPVTCTRIDIEAIAKERAQLWAEAVAAYHAGETWWIDDEELRALAEAEQEQRRVTDPWEEIIADWLDNPTKLTRDGTRVPFELDGGRVTNAQVLEHAIAKPTERQTTSDQIRVGRILHRIGWKKRRVGKARVMSWEKVDTVTTAPEPDHVYPTVSTQKPEQPRDSSQVDTVDTVTRAQARDPCGLNLKTTPPTVSTVSTPLNGGAERERIGSCAYCFDAAYSDDADKLRGGGVLHYHCTRIDSEPNHMSDRDQMLKLADVYTRTSCNGNVYLTAYLGGLKLLIFPVHKPEADGPSHTAFLAPRPPSQDRPARDAERGVATGEAINERADTWSRDQLSSSRPSGAGAGVLAGAGRAADPLTIEPIPDGGDDLPF